MVRGLGLVGAEIVADVIKMLTHREHVKNIHMQVTCQIQISQQLSPLTFPPMTSDPCGKLMSLDKSQLIRNSNL